MNQDSRSTYLYTPLFCEENIWQLAHSMVEEGVEVATMQVLFISNREKQVVLFNQRSAADLGHVVWDYHVILRHQDASGDAIYDFDSRLPFPCNSDDYIAATFGMQSELAAPLRATLRMIPADEYLSRFHSDRSHMRGVVAESDVPPWPAITPDGEKRIRLDQYWDMQLHLDDGSRTVSVDEFRQQEL